jgi:hypothetical protein
MNTPETITSQPKDNQNELNLPDFDLNEKINISTRNIRGINIILKMQT